jgi:hypothetical protein
LTNSEVRKLLSDLTVIGRDLLARGAAKVAERVRPDEEALAHVDDSAPQDQFVTEQGRIVGPNETPVLEARIPGTDTTVAQHPKDDLGSGARVKDANGEVKSGEQAYAEGTTEVRRMAQDGAKDAQNGLAEPDKKQGFMEKVRGMKVCMLLQNPHAFPLIISRTPPG